MKIQTALNTLNKRGYKTKMEQYEALSEIILTSSRAIRNDVAKNKNKELTKQGFGLWVAFHRLKKAMKK